MRSRPILSLLALAVAPAAAVLLPSESDRNVKLNGPLVPRPTGSPRNFLLTPDGASAVFEMDGLLFAVPVDGSATQAQLTPGRIASQSGSIQTSDYPLTPDGTHVVFRARAGSSGPFDLFSVPVDGSAPPTRISAGGNVLPAFGNPFVALSPDGTRAVYRADADLAGVYELFSVPVDGSLPPVKLNPDYASIEDVTDFEISADGSFVVYLANQDLNFRFELYRVPIDGSAPAFKITPDPVPGGSVLSGFELTSNDTHAVYRADQDSNNLFEVYSVPLDGSQASAKLNAPLSSGQHVQSFRVNPNGLHAAWVVQTNTGPPVGSDLFTLWLRPVAGVAPPTSLGLVATGGYGTTRYRFTPLGRIVYEDDDRLMSAISNGGGSRVTLSNDSLSWQVSSDGTYVVYGEYPLGGDLDLYSRQVNGFGPIRQLNDSRYSGLFALSPDGSLVAFASEREGRMFTEIGPVDGSVSALLVRAGSGTSLGITSDNARIVFRDDARIESLVELFSVRTDASQPTLRLSEPQGDSLVASVDTFDVSPDGQHVVFLAEGEQPGVSELYVAPVDGNSAALRLSSPPVALGEILDFVLSPDSTRVVYRGDQDTDGVIELFSVPIDGSAAPVNLSDALDPSCVVCLVSNYEITSDGAYVVYRAAQDPPDSFELYRVPIDGSAPTARLNADLPPGALLPDDFLVSPDGSRVVYRLDLPSSSFDELYSVPVSGAGVPTRLDLSVVPHRGALDFQVSGDSTRVVFRARRDAGQGLDLDLFSAPIDGSAPAVKLGGASDTSDTVARFAITPDSGAVVFSLDVDAAVGDSVWSVPLDGAGGALVLSDGLAGEGRLDDLSVSPDSGRVVFTQFVATTLNLYSVPVDASAVRTRLNPDLPPFGDVRHFSASPDSSRVVYNADQEVDGLFAYYSVPVEGGPSRRVSHTYSTGSSIFSEHRISPDSRYVVYLALSETSGLLELFAGRIEGWHVGPRSIPVNGPLVANGGVEPGAFAVTPDATRVVYLARQESEDMTELFSTFLLPEPASVTPNLGPAAGGNEVVITGCGFTPETEVFFAGKPGTVTYVSASELRIVVPPNLRIPPPTRGLAVGKTRRVVLQNLVVDVRVEGAGLGGTLDDAYTYLPYR